ncbi:MAG: glycosyltransferase 87 family protein [Actinomycetota bacterium]|nr:glycosyltransferase 87 family protein [Actinomycetota bacterium]
MRAIAGGVAKVRAILPHHQGFTRTAYLKGADRWQVSWFDREVRGRPRTEIAQVIVDDRTGAVLEAWTGHQVAWTMARGYPGAFGRKSNALYVWIPLCVLFLVPFVDPRRPLRLLHLDLLALLGFSVSLAFFNHGDIGVSVPLAYPFLAYLLVRLLLAARPRPRPPDPVRLLVPASWLAVALVFMVGFRVGLNVVNSNVIDVGYAGVIGADRLVHGHDLYGHFPADNEHGDTYGPANYLAYVPFERAFPWSGHWDDLPAAHAATVFFDLLCLLLLWVLGRRIRGPTLGIALAYAWAAYPFTLFALCSNSNDTLVAALVLATFAVTSSAPARGAFAALAGLTKFAPLALAPLLATYPRRSAREVAPFVAGFLAVGALVMLPVLLPGDLRLFWDRTLGFQETRGSPFSIYGLLGGLGTLQAAVKIGAIALAVAVAFVPRRRDLVTLAALGGAVLVAVQLGVTHWFYLYLVWFFPLAMIALLGHRLEDRRTRRPAAPARAGARSSQPVAA